MKYGSCADQHVDRYPEVTRNHSEIPGAGDGEPRAEWSYYHADLKIQKITKILSLHS